MKYEELEALIKRKFKRTELGYMVGKHLADDDYPQYEADLVTMVVGIIEEYTGVEVK